MPASHISGNSDYSSIHVSQGQLAATAAAIRVDPYETTRLVSLVSRPASQSIELPGVLKPFQIVSAASKIRSYVEPVRIDRGSRVAAGDVLIEFRAPEMKAQIAEAQSKV